MHPEAYLRAILAPDVVGAEPLPGGGSWLTSEDVQAYARWIERRAQDVERVVNAELHSGDAQRSNAAAGFVAEWMPWLVRWRAFAAQVAGAWWEHAYGLPLAWAAMREDFERLRVFHEELIALAERARALGLPVQAVPAVPRDESSLDALTRAVESAREAVLPTSWVIAGAITAVALAVIVSRR